MLACPPSSNKSLVYEPSKFSHVSASYRGNYTEYRRTLCSAFSQKGFDSQMLIAMHASSRFMTNLRLSTTRSKANELLRRVRLNQQRLASNLKSHYDSSLWIRLSGFRGRTATRRNPDVSVCLLEQANGRVPCHRTLQWSTNLGAKRWACPISLTTSQRRPFH